MDGFVLCLAKFLIRHGLNPIWPPPKRATSGDCTYHTHRSPQPPRPPRYLSPPRPNQNRRGITNNASNTATSHRPGRRRTAASHTADVPHLVDNAYAPTVLHGDPSRRRRRARIPLRPAQRLALGCTAGHEAGEGGLGDAMDVGLLRQHWRLGGWLCVQAGYQVRIRICQNLFLFSGGERGEKEDEVRRS